ncbi:MAG: Gfo/Idh/MocA family oxidoreductase [Candidatus Poribacteria bacterium]|nr:Gfo/Idh/MocA family oxidoreductase [Candidatus Poribacteria bacterium]MDE0502443.1 Gfo/Idh/MocA family oxidoreductase [Candidatus Poribacteria bacterium]
MANVAHAEPYRVAIVGTGSIATRHGRACNEVDSTELRAICDISEDSLSSFGEEFGVARRFTSLQEMLDTEKIDIAIVSTWGPSHAQTTTQLADSGRVKAILCEKPFALTTDEVEGMADAARRNGVLLAEGFKYRHHPMHLRAKELVDSGAIGDIRSIRSTLVTPPRVLRMKNSDGQLLPDRNWRWNRQKGGGSIYDVGCYCIHHARFILDAEPVRVFAVAEFGLEVDDATYIILEFANDRAAQISVGYTSWDSQYTEICGTAGMIRMDRAWSNEDKSVILQLQTKDESDNIDFEPTFQFANQLQHLCDCLSTGAPHRISLDNSVRQARVIDATFESLETGTAVEIQPA